MPIIKTEAFVIKSFRYGDTSRIVTLFTREKGKLSAIAKGIRNHKSNLSGTIGTMNHISVILYYKDNRELQLVSKAEFVNSYPEIFKSMEKLSSAYRIIEFLNKYVTEHYSDSPIFDLLVNIYSGLNKSATNFELFTLRFLIEMSALLGLFPILNDSYEQKETLIGKNEFGLNETLLNELYNISRLDLNDLESLDLETENVVKLMKMFEQYMATNLQVHRYSRAEKVFGELY